MRKIIIEIETDSEESIDWLAEDLANEIRCCSAFYYVDTMIVKEEQSD